METPRDGVAAAKGPRPRRAGVRSGWQLKAAAGEAALDTPPADAEPLEDFDCEAGYSNWAAGWSADKKAFCCKKEDKGCEAKEDFDCEAGYSNWAAGWSADKKVFCCKTEQKGCEALPSCDDPASGEEEAPATWIPDLSGAGVNLTVMTFNLEKSADSIGQNPFASRGRQDIMGFQGCPDARELVHYGVTREDVVLQGEDGLCMAYKNSSFALMGQGLENVAEDKEGDQHRRAQWMRLRHLELGKFVFFVNHRGPEPFDSGGACGADQMERSLRRLVARQAQPGDLIVVVGDLNVAMNSPVVTHLAKRLTRVYASEPGTSLYIFANIGGGGGVSWQESSALGATISAAGAASTPAPPSSTAASTPASEKVVQEAAGATTGAPANETKTATSATTSSTVTLASTATTTTTTYWCMADVRKIPRKVWRAPSTGAAARFKMLTMNMVWWNVGQPDDPDDLPEAVIRSSGEPYMYDAIGLQECKEPRRLLKKLGPDAEEYDVIEEGSGLCTLYLKDQWTLQGHGLEAVAVDQASVEESVGVSNRSVQWLRMVHSETRRPFFVMNYHGPLPLNSGGGCGGEVTAQRLIGVIMQNALEGDAVILSGAFNAKGFTPVIQVLEQHGLGVFKVSHDGSSEYGEDFVISNAGAASLISSANLGRGGRFHDVLGVIFEIGRHPGNPDVSKASDSEVLPRYYTWTTSTVTVTTSTSTKTTTSTVTGPQPFECPAAAAGTSGPLWSTTGRPKEVRLASLSLGNSSAGLPESSSWKDYDAVVFQGCTDPDQVSALGEPFGVVIHRFGLCTAYRLSQFSVLDQGQAAVAEDKDAGPAGKRGAQWVRLVAEDGRAVFLVNHEGPQPVDSGGKCGGKATAQALLDTVYRHAQDGDAVVLAGRFNSGPESDTIQELQLHFAHVCTLAAAHQSEGSFVFSNGELEVDEGAQDGNAAGILAVTAEFGSMIITG
ncbi:unnamed protein product [Prorocentrum cordatum]|uniref:Sphingomyelin phosphodiesterase n=1 Tax=Prorocentrum cordatum TaxID=2364126 RepID=A0ABN9VK21_9DINO|nr:unnamed protein product [Polarella glacialis]